MVNIARYRAAQHAVNVLKGLIGLETPWLRDIRIVPEEGTDLIRIVVRTFYFHEEAKLVVPTVVNNFPVRVEHPEKKARS